MSMKFVAKAWLVATSLMILSLAGFAQDLRSLDYTRSDSIALHFSAVGIEDPGELSRRLTAGLETEAERFRVLYRWVAENIRYDYSAKSADPAQVLKKREAVCAGYAYLLRELCAYAFIKCEVIDGYAKAGSDAVGRMSDSNHSWNAVFMNGQWYLADVTWAAGYTDKKQFVKSYSEDWFLVDPVRFQNRHRPENKRWFLSESKFTKRQFFRQPVRYEGYYNMGIGLARRTTGILARDHIIIETASYPIESAVFFRSAGEETYPCTIEKRGDGYALHFSESEMSPGAYYLSLNGVTVLKFVKRR